MSVLEASFLSVVWKRVILFIMSMLIYLVCLFRHFLRVFTWDLLDACFSKGTESFEIIHQNTGCQDKVVKPLTPLIFKCGKEL